MERALTVPQRTGSLPNVTHPDVVRARMASVWLGANHQREQVGGFALRPSQVEALVRVRDSLERFGGALLADPPGTGKTIIALAACAPGVEVLVVAPATLRAQWHRASQRAGRPIRFVSVEALSRGEIPLRAPLVIVDEAQHVRTVTTRRYRALAALCVGARVLLLSATPLVNRNRDRDALLGLFLGSTAVTLEPDELARCIIRRRAPRAARPTVLRNAPLRGDAEVPGLADALARLPPPFPLREAAPGTTLITISLALAWRSSLAALDASLRRRVQRGEALADLLRSGQWPTPAALRHWVIDEEVTQLALPALLGPDAAVASTESIERAERALSAHLEAVRAMRDLIRPRVGGDAETRAAAIRALAIAHPGDRLIVFARHAETIRALHRALRRDPGVVAITGARVSSTAGRWNREEVLSAIGPLSSPLRHDDPRMIRIVLATDLLAEGVEMQGIRVVVHGDLPWNPARLEQRLGRVTRLGSRSRDVTEAWFEVPSGAEAFVRLAARLERKARLGRHAVRDGDSQSRLEALLRDWRAAPRDRERRHLRGGCIASVGGSCDAFVALVRRGRALQLICGRARSGLWSLSSAPHRCLAVIRQASGAAVPHDEAMAKAVMHRLSRFLRRRVAHALTGARATSDVARRCLARMDGSLRKTPLLLRSASTVLHRCLRDALDRPLAAGLEHRLSVLLGRALDDHAFVRELSGLLVESDHEPRSRELPGRPQLIALLLVRPAARSTQEAEATSAP